MNCNPTFTAAKNQGHAQMSSTFVRNTSEPAGIPTNVKVAKDAYVIQLALPGFQSSDLNIQMEGNTLTVLAKTSESYTKPNVRLEFSASERKRHFSLPKDVEYDQITARLEHGILEIRLPKARKQSAQTIQIQ